jgi:replicative DNA helicase
MLEPFVDFDLERKSLRQLIFDSAKDGKEVETEVLANVGYIVGLGETNEIFKDDFNRKLFEEIVRIYMSFTQCITKKHLIRFIKKEFSKDENEYEKHVIMFDQVFKFDFEKLAFKIIWDELRNNFYYRTIHSLNLEVNADLRSIFEKREKKTPVQLAQTIEETIGKVLSSSGKYKVIEEDILQNVNADIQLIRDKRADPEKYKGIPTGFAKIDEVMGGFYPGEEIIVLGRPGQGKSILLLGFGAHAYDCGYNVIYITLEMPLAQQKLRYYSRVTNIAYKKLKMPQYMAADEVVELERRMLEEKTKHKNYLWFVDAPPNSHIAFVESRVVAFENLTGKKCDLLIIDPLYFLRPTIEPKDGDHVGQVSVDIKYLARKFKFPAIAASQTNRAGGSRHKKGKDADTADAAFSDKIGQNADNMIFITGEKHRAKLEFAKTRDSQIGSLYFTKEFDVMKFKYDPIADEEVQQKEEQT